MGLLILIQVAQEQAERRATAQLMFELGQKAYGKGTYGRAIEFLEAALTIIPRPTLFGGEVGWLLLVNYIYSYTFFVFFFSLICFMFCIYLCLMNWLLYVLLGKFQIQIWLAMAYEANNRHADCIDLYKQLEKKHPSLSIRRQASELRYILQAPKLKISQEEMVTIPLIGSSYDR